MGEILKNYHPPYGFKIVQVGDGAVGKTTLFMRYVNGVFPDDYIPTVFDNYATNVMVSENSYTIHLW